MAVLSLFQISFSEKNIKRRKCGIFLFFLKNLVSPPSSMHLFRNFHKFSTGALLFLALIFGGFFASHLFATFQEFYPYSQKLIESGVSSTALTSDSPILREKAYSIAV